MPVIELKRDKVAEPRADGALPGADAPVCSVCIANFNGIGMIDKCLDAVFSQKCSISFEVIVHDDASTDRSVPYIRSRYPEARLISSRENIGFCESNNRMADQARGRYLLILNNDAILFPDALQTFYTEAETSGAFSPILGLRQFSAHDGALLDFGIFFDPFLNSVPNEDLTVREVGMIMGACLWLPKSLWNAIGGFPKWFHTMHEDMWICCRAWLGGHSVRVIPKSGYLHWVGRSLGGGKIVGNKMATPLKRRFLSERNRIFVMVVCYPSPVFQIIFPAHILLLLLEGALLSIVKKKCDLMRSIYWAVINAAWLKRKDLCQLRAETQAARSIPARRFFRLIRPLPHKLRMLVKHGLPEVF